jgi:hypothetical protein
VASIDTVTATSNITRANKKDTSAYLLLDTVTNLLWHYQIGSNGWIQAGGSTLDTATMLLPYYRAGRNTIIQVADVPTLNQNTTGSAATLTTGRTIQTNLASTSAATFNGSANITPGVTGTLPVANGGTGANMSSLPNNYLVRKNLSGIFDTTAIYYTGSNLLVGTITDNTARLRVNGAGNRALNVTGNGYSIFQSDVYALTPSNIGLSLGWNRSGGNGEATIVWGAAAAGYNFEIASVLSDVITPRLAITNTGNVGIGTTTPQSGYKLHVIDSVYVGGRVSAAGYTTRSDYDLKNEIQSLNYGLNEVIQMKPVKYTYKSNGEQQLGFIAQDIGTLIPESVHFDSFMGVDYQSIIPILTKAIQQQQAQIEILKQRLLILENK